MRKAETQAFIKSARPVVHFQNLEPNGQAQLLARFHHRANNGRAEAAILEIGMDLNVREKQLVRFTLHVKQSCVDAIDYNDLHGFWSVALTKKFLLRKVVPDAPRLLDVGSHRDAFQIPKPFVVRRPSWPQNEIHDGR